MLFCYSHFVHVRDGIASLRLELNGNAIVRESACAFSCIVRSCGARKIETLVKQNDIRKSEIQSKQTKHKNFPKPNKIDAMHACVHSEFVRPNPSIDSITIVVAILTSSSSISSFWLDALQLPDYTWIDPGRECGPGSRPNTHTRTPIEPEQKKNLIDFRAQKAIQSRPIYCAGWPSLNSTSWK